MTAGCVERERGEALHELPFSRYVAVRNWVYISGIIGRNPNTGAIALGDPEKQTEVALHALRNVLQEAGCSLGDLVKVTVFLTDLRMYGEVNRVYREVLERPFPARSCVEVQGLPDKEAVVEIEAIAYRGGAE